MKIRSLPLILLLASCSNYVPHQQIAASNVAVQDPEAKIIYKEVVRTVEKPIHVTSPNFDAIHDMELNYKQKHFDFWVKYFSKKEKERFLRHANNGAKYRNVVNKILISHGLPTDLFYVGLIESGYNTHIKSRASAVGPWQFIKGTAKRYGLRVDGYVDERRNIIKATEAAANYFKDLYNIFGSWELALCAYNKGEYGIIRAIRKGNTRDYKELVRKKLIPTETIFYIPKIAAARAIFEAPRKYGLSLPAPKNSPFEKVKEIKYRRSFDLNKVARAHGISLRNLKVLNPDLRKRWVRVRRKRQKVFVPSASATNFKELAQTYSPAPLKRNSNTYRVKRGDNLYKIASRLGIGMKALKKINGIRGSKIFVGQKLKVPGKNRSVASASKTIRHKVRRGENLSLIARRYKTTVSRILRMNKLRSSKIYVGQKLLVQKGATGASLVKYKVQRGDNLIKIARRFKTSIPTLKRTNALSGNVIYKGQILKIPSEG